MIAKLRSGEGGFTLVEVLVATLLMTMVLMALYALFDMSTRVYGIGNSKTETNERARVALEKMEREIRNAKCEATCLISGNGAEIKLDTQVGSASQEVHYVIVDGELKRNSESLARIGSSASPLSLRYCNSSYVCSSSFNANPAMVEITLRVESDGSTQTLNTVAGLRNSA